MAAQSEEHPTASDLVKPYAPFIKEKVILVTGASPNSLGAAFINAITASQPAHVILAGRNTERTQQTCDQLKASSPDVNVSILYLDLSSLAAVREAAQEVISWTHVPHIDVLVNSAAVMATDWKVSKDGYESQFAINHLGPFLFTNLIMEKLLASSAPRIVTVSSDCHRLGGIRFHDFNFHDGMSYNRWQAYGQAKTANALMALSFAEKLGQNNRLLSLSLHPGVINTNLFTHLGAAEIEEMRALDRTMGNPHGWASTWTTLTPDEGVSTYVYAAFDPNLTSYNGAYLERCSPADPNTTTLRSWATSSVEAEMLWKLSEKLVGQTFSY
ncbi:hypothetical protein EV127DRAFT_388241 [Xylaria flabelliformis]|nr:hypothetical protein EV127DRAFT_388241 [Xylaria flabelliformis]